MSKVKASDLKLGDIIARGSCASDSVVTGLRRQGLRMRVWLASLPDAAEAVFFGPEDETVGEARDELASRSKMMSTQCDTEYELLNR